MDPSNVPRIGAGDIERLVPKVEQWFREATTEFQPPSVSGCRTVAFYLLVLGRTPRAQHSQSATTASAKALRRRLAGEDESISKSLDLMLREQPNRKWLREAQQLQSKVRAANQAIDELLPLLSPPRDPALDPIRHLAAVVREAWEETNGGQAPRSNNTDDPTCKFLVKALEGRQSVNPDTISEILRGRRRNR